MLWPRSMIAIFCLAIFVNPLGAAPIPKDLPKRGPIDPKTIAAYKKIGGQYGCFRISQFGQYHFWPGEDAKAKDDLPGFRIVLTLKDTFPTLPSVNVLFGLDLGSSVTDEDLKEIRGFKTLAALKLCGTKVTDAGMKELKDIQNLTSLDLSFTKVTGEGLKELKELKNLTSLHLGETQVTDATLKELVVLKNLTSLDLGGTQVTEESVKALHKALPKCKILR